MSKKILCLLLTLSMILLNFSMLVSYAVAVPITEESIEKSLQDFVASNSNEKNYKISVKNNIISVESDDGKSDITYDLTDKPTFSYTVDIKKGIDYKTFEEKTANLSSPMIGYMAVANTQGVEYEDALVYFSMQLLSAAFSGTSSIDLNDSYMIVSDDVIVEGSNKKIIKESEFGDRVMEYVNAMYGEKKIMNDKEGIDSFEYVTEMKEVTSNSCKIVTTLTVNPDADFSQMQGALKAIEDAFANSFGGDNNISSLTDIEGTKYEIAVERLVNLGVINGFEDNTFRPTENVTRAQFAKMIVEASNLYSDDNSTALSFSDLSENHWAYSYIKTAVDNGIINGYPEGTFKPDNPVTYAESMAMILRAMKIEETMSDKSWPMGYINEAMKIGLLDSVDYTEPNIPANRGETAISLYNMINLLEDSNSGGIKTVYSNENGEITLEELEDGSIYFSFDGLANGEMWSLGTTLDYSNGIASTEDDSFEDIVKIKIIIEKDKITVEASSTDPESGYNGIDGTYKLKGN